MRWDVPQTHFSDLFFVKAGKIYLRSGSTAEYACVFALEREPSPLTHKKQLYGFFLRLDKSDGILTLILFSPNDPLAISLPAI